MISLLSATSFLLQCWLFSDPSLAAKLRGEVDPRMPLREWKEQRRSSLA